MFRDIIAVYFENRRKTRKHSVWENGGILSVTDSGEYFYHFDLNGLYSSQGYESKFLYRDCACNSHKSRTSLCLSTIKIMKGVAN
jgi:hypothetical protein